jgi:SagB-type dehydrogenase family enzyme
MLTVTMTLVAATWLLVACTPDDATPEQVGDPVPAVVQLPDPVHDGALSLEATISARRSVRDWGPDPVTLDELGQLLWAAQGITAEWGGRSAPSAGGTYPLEVHAVVSAVEGLEPGVYRYRPHGHQLVVTIDGDLSGDLARVALDQASVRTAPLNLVITAVPERTAERYGARADRYATLEAGHAAQNVALQAVSLGLGSVPIGAFTDDEAARLLRLPDGEVVRYILPIGPPASR